LAGPLPTGFCLAPAVDYLGFRISAGGKVFLSRKNTNKFKHDLRRIVHYAFHANRFCRKNNDAMIGAIINAINLFFEKELLQRHIPDLLRTTNDLEELKKLDKWVAKLALRHSFRTGHDKVFRFTSYRSLRSRGLVSLVHLHNTAMRRRGLFAGDGLDPSTSVVLASIDSVPGRI
jgi:hypothetical protein